MTLNPVKGIKGVTSTFNIKSATTKINLFKETAEKAGLQISFEKTEYITNMKNALKQLRTDYGKINKVEKFKYLGKIVQFCRAEREPNQMRIRKLETALQLTRNLYNKKSISRKVKIQHYNTVIKL